MQLYRAFVPENCKEGETLRIRISERTNAVVRVVIPSGLFSGDSFLFELPTKEKQQQQQTTKSFKRQQKKTKNQDQQHQQQEVIAIAEIETRSDSDDSIKTVIASPVHDGTSHRRSGGGGENNKAEKKSFLEREIIDRRDFSLALTIGLLVGSSIVFGFFLGILQSTEAIYAVHPIEKPKQQAAPKQHQQQHQQHQQRFTKLPNSRPTTIA